MWRPTEIVKHEGFSRQLTAETIIDQFHLALLVYQDVFQLQVPMDYLKPMQVLQSLSDLPRDGLRNRLASVVSLALQPVSQGSIFAQFSDDIDGFLSFDGLLIGRNARMLHHLQNIYLIFEISPSVFVGQRTLLVRLYCEFLSLSIACYSDYRIRSPSQNGPESIILEALRKLYFGHALLRPEPVVIIERIDAPLPGEERIGHIDPRKSLLVFGLLVAELDLLQGEQIEVGLLEQLQFFVGVAHDPGLLALQRLAGEVGVIVGVGADLADIGQFNRLAQLHLSRLHQHGGLGL